MFTVYVLLERGLRSDRAKLFKKPPLPRRTLKRAPGGGGNTALTSSYDRYAIGRLQCFRTIFGRLKQSNWIVRSYQYTHGCTEGTHDALVATEHKREVNGQQVTRHRNVYIVVLQL